MKVTRRVRLVVDRMSAGQMLAVADPVAAAIRDRIRAGRNVADQAAAPLTARYARQKQRAGLPAVRDWRWTGRTLEALGVVESGDGRAVIGFRDPVAAARARWNNRREEQFGVSPADRGVLREALARVARAVGLVRVVKR